MLSMLYIYIYLSGHILFRHVSSENRIILILFPQKTSKPLFLWYNVPKENPFPGYFPSHSILIVYVKIVAIYILLLYVPGHILFRHVSSENHIILILFPKKTSKPLFLWYNVPKENPFPGYLPSQGISIV